MQTLVLLFGLYQVLFNSFNCVSVQVTVALAQLFFVHLHCLLVEVSFEMACVSHSLLVLVRHAKPGVRFAYVPAERAARFKAPIAKLALEGFFFVGVPLAATIIRAVVTQRNFWRGLNIVGWDCSLDLLRIFIGKFGDGGLESGRLSWLARLWFPEMLVGF